jgi:hypothetical protein
VSRELSAETLKNLHAESGAKIPENAAFVSVQGSDEHTAVETASAVVQELIKKDAYRQLVGSMVAFRRAYAVCYRQMQDLLAAEPEGTIPTMVEDIFIGVSASESAKPFDENALMKGIVETVLPWLADTVNAHTDTDEAEEKIIKDAAEERRRLSPIPLGFTHHQHQDDKVLTRERGLVLVGYGPALNWLVDSLLKCLAENGTVEGDPIQVVHLRETAPKRGESHRYLASLPVNNWQGCCNTNKGVATVMGTFVADQLALQPDLLICSNMGLAFTRGFTGRPVAASAGDAYKQFSRWCERAGCAFIGLIPVPDKSAQDVTGLEYEQLRTFAHLRQVCVRIAPDDPDSYEIQIGTGSILKALVTDVEAHRKLNVIVTGR